MSSDMTKADVLIVDDDPGIRTLLMTVLKRAGYRCETVGDGADVIPAIESERPKVVLLDVMLPHVSGVEVLATLRERSPDLLPHVIVITAASKRDLVKVEPYRDVVFRLLRKPFDIGELTDAVRDCSRQGLRPQF